MEPTPWTMLSLPAEARGVSFTRSPSPGFALSRRSHHGTAKPPACHSCESPESKKHRFAPAAMCTRLCGMSYTQLYMPPIGEHAGICRV